jgi:GR25 family glycosyltransferase involved in LPS biosynthesis
MFEFKIFVLTLESRPDRIENIKKFYKDNIDEITFFYGLKQDTLKQFKPKITTIFCNNHCTIPMVGCASSHILLWKYIAEFKDSEYILILEDDTFINLNYLSSIFKHIKYLFEKNNKQIFLQIVGEGFNLLKIERINDKIFKNYSYHFFLGAYMVTPNIARILYKYFFEHGINYHIDYSLNHVFTLKNIKPLLLSDSNIGKQLGQSDSNMNNQKSSKSFAKEANQKLHYVLNMPLFSYGSLIITFNFIFLLIFLIIAFYTKNVFYFAVISILAYDIINFEIY